MGQAFTPLKGSLEYAHSSKHMKYDYLIVGSGLFGREGRGGGVIFGSRLAEFRFYDINIEIVLKFVF